MSALKRENHMSQESKPQITPLCFETQKDEIIARLIMMRFHNCLGDSVIFEGEREGQIRDQFLSAKEAEVVVTSSVDADKEYFDVYPAILATHNYHIAAK